MPTNNKEKDLKKIYDYLSANDILSIGEPTAEDIEDGITDSFEKFKQWANIDYTNTYAIYKDSGYEAVFFFANEGKVDYVEDQFDSTDDPKGAAISALKEVSGMEFEELYKIWGMEIEYVDDVTEVAIVKVASKFMKIAAGTGIGNYRRGKVLTDVKTVQPGQLLVWESLVFNAVNLVKVTETFDDKFYGIIVKPANPAEKAKASDEEFVVYSHDLEKGEWYIALEPAPGSVEPEQPSEAPKAPTEEVPAAKPMEATPEEKPAPEAAEEAIAPKGAGLKSPVRINEDYGMTKKAWGEEPATCQETRYDADQAKGKDTYVTDEDVEKTTFASYADFKPTKETEEDEELETEEDEEKETSEYKFMSVDEDDESEDDMELFDELESNITIGSDWTSASFKGKVIAKAKDEAELAENLFLWMEENEFVNIVAIDEKGNPVTYYIEKDGDTEQVVESTKDALPMAFGSANSIVSNLIANIETIASAPGGEGDCGDAYSLVDGRNTSGVDEHMVEGSVKEFLDGKLLFATLEDFAGFAEDMWGVKNASKDLVEAWHNDDAKAIVAYVKANAK